MEVLVDRIAALDVHKDTVMACVGTPGERNRRRQEIQEFSTFTASLRALREWLAAEAVTVVVMEATGVYWRPVVRHDALFDRAVMKGHRLRAVAAACWNPSRPEPARTWWMWADCSARPDEVRHGRLRRR
ncbi:MAG: hypothetical protein M0Z30_11910 [Actinomycetota bacterium]|nr:hypothetical protein [Actinomycetota bacterium]